MIIYHGRKKSRASFAQFLFSLVSILVINLSWLPNVLAATNCKVVTEISQTECETLIALYNSTAGPNWTDKDTNNWNVTNTPCSWTGITCGSGHITKITENSHNLISIIPDLSALTQLRELELSNNQLSGPIPNLSALTQL
jgi:Leucine-rich repeat (LRR) protein